ncbi:MAG: SMP-30/gluconolactonase/LRE family protein [Sedimentisphaerales bacterium]
MLFQKSTQTHKTCPKTGKIIDTSNKKRRFWWFLPFTGLFALIWFLIRVIPKPSRATYPCQRVAFPLASGFIIWVTGLAGSAVAFRKAKRAMARARYVVAAIAIIASIGFIWGALSNTDIRSVFAADDPNTPNVPIGTGRGVHPGRVAWIWDANSTSWAGGHPPYYWDNTITNQQVVNQMFSKAIRALTGRGDDATAWDAIFRNYNQTHGRGNVGYTQGEKIAIKMNWVLMINQTSGAQNNGYLDSISISPQLAIALLNQLTNVADVNPGNISIGDPQNCMADYWYNIVGPNCPGVVYLTKSGVVLDGRTQVARDYNAPFYWSDPITNRHSDSNALDFIPTHFSQATYFIDFAILKSHNDGGITLCGKNHYGSLMRAPNEGTYYNEHFTRATERPGMGYYRAIVDLLGHPKLGGKTMLCLIDGLYGGQSWDSQPIRYLMAPFNHDWPSSIFLSQDPVAIDSVAYDFLWTELDGIHTPTYDPNPEYNYPHKSGAHDYLHEAAKVPHPDSDVNYDPNHDGGLKESLGVHEHWNNATDKKYSRNLGTGNGIELVTATPGWPDLTGDRVVDFKDFAVLANAWGSRPGDSNWDANSDISAPADNVIDMKDLDILCENWLADYSNDLIRPGATLQELYSISGSAFEGATWDPNSHKLFFTKRTSPFQILRYESPGSVTVWQTPSSETNGMIIGNDGRLLTCDENPMRISSYRIDPCGPADLQVLADTTDGISRKPNDLCQLSNGNIYFTCPDWSADANASGQGVFLLKPDGSLSMVKNGIFQPNGIITSLDETKLYVAESRTNADTSRQRWWIFDINPDGSLSNGAIFFKPSNPPDNTHVADGMTIDELGNLYFCGLGGVWIVSPAGQQLGFISGVKPYNICFGGNDGRTLYLVTGNGKLYSLAMVVRGGESSSW